MRTASLVSAAALGLAAAFPVAAQETSVQQERVHVVQKGETLWDLARVYLNDPFLWPEIFRLNTRVVEDPALIYPRERLVIPGGARGREQVADGRTVFFPRGGEVQRENGLTIRPAGSAEVPVITPGDFYRASFVARDGEVSGVGQIAEVVSPTVVPLGRSPQIQPYDRVFVPLTGSGVKVGDRLSFVRRGSVIEPYGYVFHSTGMGTVAAVDDNVATVVVTRLYDRAAPGDIAVPVARFPVRTGVVPVTAGAGLEARVLGFEGPHELQAIEEIAFLDVGRNSGVREGDEFVVFLPREQRAWGSRPEVRVGRVQVVRVMEQTASARITGLDQPALAPGLPARRVAKMP